MTRLTRHHLRLVRAHAQARIGMLRLIVATFRRQAEEIWVGDSHSVLFNTSRFPFPYLASPDGGRRWVWHLGPRLMFSIARDGFLPGMSRWIRVLSFVPGASRTTWFFVFGEIDVRCHLAPRLSDGADLAFVDRYLDRVGDLVRSTRSRQAVIVVPPPPSSDVLDHRAFPVVGSPAERVRAHRAVRDRLVTAVARDWGSSLRVLDMTPVLADATGMMLEDYTDDGCHTNDAGRRIVRDAVDVQRAQS